MLLPRVMPILWLAFGEPWEKVLVFLYVEVVEEELRGAVIRNVPVIKHDHAIAEGKMPQTVRDAEYEPILAAG